VNQAITQIWTPFLGGDLNAVAAGCCRAGRSVSDPPNADRCPDLPIAEVASLDVRKTG